MQGQCNCLKYTRYIPEDIEKTTLYRLKYLKSSTEQFK